MTDSTTSRRPAPWIRAPAWDVLGLALPWVPFYLFLVFGLGIDGSWSAGAVGGAGREPGLGLAIAVALGISYVHRHYTFLLVYGDRPTYERRELAFSLSPALVFVVLALTIRAGANVRLPWPGAEEGVAPWMLVLLVTGLWNVWHSIMQRHGITRIYAGKAGGGLQERAHGRRDLRLIWSLAILTAVVVLRFRPSTFEGIGNARRLLSAAEPWLHGPLGWGLLAAAGGAVAWFALDWGRHEAAADVALGDRVPRWTFMGSTLALLGVFVVHGPVVGYLCFGVAHAIEYVCFLHHFGYRKFARPDAEGRRSLAGRVLASPWISAPAIVLALAAAYLLLFEYKQTELYLVYYTGTSLLHFLFDGWIWKVRKPEVAQPLGLKAATATTWGSSPSSGSHGLGGP